MKDDPYGTQMPFAPLPLPAVLFLLLLLFILGILFAMCESAVNCANEARMKKDAENGNHRAKQFLQYLDKNESFMSPLQLGMLLTIFFAIGISVLEFSASLSGALKNAGFFAPLSFPLAVVLCILIVSTLFLTLADFVPKKLIAHKSMQSMDASYKLLSILRILSGIMLPLLKLCDLISNGIMRLMGNDPHTLDETVTEEEILHMVGEGEEKGVIEETERNMITNILDFNDTTASEIMTHRTDICAISEDTPLADVAAVAVEEGFSRVPVYREDIDTIVGICYVKDLLPYIGKPIPEFVQLRDIIRPAYFIPETKKCSQLFQEMTERKVQIAIIVDEYGGTSGLVSLEDLVESILGNIQDEYDNEEEEIFRVSENEFTVDGSTSIDEISDLTGVELPEGDYDTIAGLVTEILARIPKEDEHPSVTVKNLTITVQAVEDQRLSKLLIVKNEHAPDTDDDEKDDAE